MPRYRELVETVLSKPIIDGVTEVIDLKRRPYAVKKYHIRVRGQIDVAGGNATMKAFWPSIFLKKIRLQGSRPGGSDTIKNLTGFQLFRLNAIDKALPTPIHGPEFAPALTVLAPGSYFFLFNYILTMVPPRMTSNTAVSTLLPAPRYPNLSLELDLESAANLRLAGPGTVTLAAATLDVEEVSVPTVDVAGTDFALFLENYTRETIDNVAQERQVRLNTGNLYRQVCLLAYEQATAFPNDFLIEQVRLKENVATLRSEKWNLLRERNLTDFNLGFEGAGTNAGFAVIDFAELGMPENLLDTSDFPGKGRELTVDFNVPVAPPAVNYLDVISRIIVPQVNR